MVSNHTASGPMAGYLFQLERALYWLAKSDCQAAMVGIETEDDVCVRYDGDNPSANIREQDKHSLVSHGNPFSDTSYNLWNTFFVWLKAVDNGDVQLDNTEFHLVTNRIVPSRSIVGRLSRATTDQHYTECVTQLRSIGSSASSTISIQTRFVLSHSDEALICFLKRIRVSDGTLFNSTSLKEKIISELHISSEIPGENIYSALLGWLANRVLDLWREGQPAWISRKALDRQFNQIIFRYKSKVFEEKAAHLIKVSKKDRDTQLTRMFVKQLYLLAVPEESEDGYSVFEAVTDFLRCHSERVRLSREGFITEQDLLSFDDRLLQRWRVIFDRHCRPFLKSNSIADDDQQLRSIGYQIFLDTLNHREPLAGQETYEYYLTRGSYHRLADIPKVGWHPRFRKLLAL